MMKHTQVLREMFERKRIYVLTGGTLLGQYMGPGYTNQPAISFSDQPAVGRWVVIQKNSAGIINIAEIYVSSNQTGELET